MAAQLVGKGLDLASFGESRGDLRALDGHGSSPGFPLGREHCPGDPFPCRVGGYPSVGLLDFYHILDGLDSPVQHALA